MEEQETKRCAMCGLYLPMKEFNRNKNSTDGYQSYCKKCTAFYRAHGYSKRSGKIIIEKRERKTKQCSMCSQRKLLDQFNLCQTSSDGYQNYCRDCSVIYRKAKRFKTCSKCGQEKSVYDFYQCTNSEDGFFDRCKDCCHTHNQSVAVSDSHYDNYFSGRKIW